jgi:hypothetical protein
LTAVGGPPPDGLYPNDFGRSSSVGGVSLRERIAEREASPAERAELLREKLADVEYELGPPSAWAADSTTSASDEPTPEPTSCS